MNKIEKPVLDRNTYTCVHCGATKLSPTLPKGWKEFYYLDTTDNYGNTWHLGYSCAECAENSERSLLMKIIKPGAYKPPTYRFTCNKCGCVYECTESELKHEQPDGFYPGHDYTDCPTCNAHLSVDLHAEVLNG